MSASLRLVVLGLFAFAPALAANGDQTAPVRIYSVDGDWNSNNFTLHLKSGPPIHFDVDCADFIWGNAGPIGEQKHRLHSFTVLRELRIEAPPSADQTGHFIRVHVDRDKGGGSVCAVRSWATPAGQTPPPGQNPNYAYSKLPPDISDPWRSNWRQIQDALKT